MNKITDDGKYLLTRLSQGKLVFTSASLDNLHELNIIGSSTNENIFTLKLRVDNLGLNSNLVYQQIIVKAKIEGDSKDVIYAIIDKSSYVPAQTSVPEFVEDIDLCFVFSDVENITVDNVGYVYALNKDLQEKPNLFVGINKPTNLNSSYIWYQTFGEDLDFGNSDGDENDTENDTNSDTVKEVMLDLTDEEKPLNILINGELKGVDNATENSPLEFIIEL